MDFVQSGKMFLISHISVSILLILLLVGSARKRGSLGMGVKGQGNGCQRFSTRGPAQKDGASHENRQGIVKFGHLLQLSGFQRRKVSVF